MPRCRYAPLGLADAGLEAFCSYMRNLISARAKVGRTPRRARPARVYGWHCFLFLEDNLL